MKVLICYDVADDRRRRQLIKYLEKYSVRIQFSVFLGELSNSQLEDLNAYGNKLLEKDKLGRLYICKVGSSTGTPLINNAPGEYVIV